MLTHFFHRWVLSDGGIGGGMAPGGGMGGGRPPGGGQRPDRPEIQEVLFKITLADNANAQ